MNYRNGPAAVKLRTGIGFALSVLLCSAVNCDADVNHVFGADATQWNITDEAKVDLSLMSDAVITGPVGGLVLERARSIEPNSEVTMRIRLGAASGKSTSFSFCPALKTSDDLLTHPLSLKMESPGISKPETVNLQLNALPGKDSGLVVPYVVRMLPKERLNWPSDVRALVEHDYASVTTLAQRWLTLQYTVHRDSAQLYVDGKLLRDYRPALFKTQMFDLRGKIRLALSEGTQVESVRVRRISPENPVYQTVPLDFSLNSSQIAGGPIRHDFKLSSHGTLELGKVPFRIPQSDAKGNDHLDVGQSWFRAARLEGYFDPGEGDAARWLGMMQSEPRRLTFQVRNAPYSHLHLLAAFDGQPNKTPIVSVQFYRPESGHPVTFSAKAPSFSARSTRVRALPVNLDNGKRGRLYLVTIPLEPEGLSAFSDQEYLEFEITKEVHVYRSFPAIAYFSQHGGGLPSGVHIYGMTLEQPPVTADLQPDKFAHVWTAPEKPSYTVALNNITGKSQNARLALSTRSYDGSDKALSSMNVKLPAHASRAVRMPLDVKLYGYHSVKLVVKDTQGTRTQTRSLAYLHPDTRERGNWQEGRGPLYGFWDWHGFHGTPKGVERLRTANAIGVESSSFPLLPTTASDGIYTNEELAYAEANGWQTQYLAYQIVPGNPAAIGVQFDASKPDEMKASILETLRKSETAKPSKLNKPEMAIFWAEPLLGPVSWMSFPEYYGDPPYVLSEDERAAFKNFNEEFIITASAIKKEWPNAKCYMPWGVASFPIPFLRESKEATALMDGPAIDQVLMERMPEMQMHQIAFPSMLWQLKQEWIKAGKKWPTSLVTVEGGGLAAPATPGALTMQEEADYTIRGELILDAYGVNRHLGWPSIFDCAGSWGESHYGGGLCERMPLLSPKISFSAYATMTRQRNRMNYVKTIETGSASVFCLQFKHYKTGELLHVFWTLRGKRPVRLKGIGSSRPTFYDSMDNPTVLNPKAGEVAFQIDSSPVYVRGLKADALISLGTPDHIDARPSAGSVRISNLANGEWKLSNVRDDDYETAHLEFVRKFPAEMKNAAVKAPVSAGGKALSVHLPLPEKERRTMSFYTTLVPEKPIAIGGKASHLGLWVRAASDWGRIVYCLRDAKGERWLSVGKKDEWNQDDIFSWSAFNFDGWRYVRFEMPSQQPWDLYHDMGSSLWGYYGNGDGTVDLPLKLEKIMIERRTHVIKVDAQIEANPEDILLGDLYAEYKTPSDKTEETVRLSKLRMPLPAGVPELDNPIKQLAIEGNHAAPSIDRVAPPSHQYDGTRCHVFFDPVVKAVSYDIWVSTYEDGRGAVNLGEKWASSGQLLTGLPASTEVYLFLTWTDAEGRVSKPSPAKKIFLRDEFPFK